MATDQAPSDIGEFIDALLGETHEIIDRTKVVSDQIAGLSEKQDEHANSHIDMRAFLKEIDSDIQNLYQRLDGIETRLSGLVESHNQVGQNIAWIVANTQGIFQMFNSPEMLSQMMGMIGGGVLGGGRPQNPSGE